MPERTATSLWLISPAWGRFALSAVCFEQWTQVRDVLAERGVELRVVVVADDENLELARARGFDTFERDNEWLGRRFNDGMEYAARHGADWIAPIGSDTWIDPDYLTPLPADVRSTRAMRQCSVVTVDRLAELRVGRNGVGPFMFHRSLLEPHGFRPTAELLSRRIDGSMLGALAPQRWEYRDRDAMQHIGFRGNPHLTSYERLWYFWGVAEYRNPWELLAERYPAPLVAAAQAALQ